MDINRNGQFSNLANAVRLEMLETGYARLKTDWHMEDVCSPYSRLYYVISGEGVLYLPIEEKRKKTGEELQEESRQTDLQRTPVYLRPGHMYLIPNGLFYSCTCSEYLEKLYFHVNIRMQDGFDLFRGCKTCYELPVEEAHIQTIKALYAGKTPADAFALKGTIYADIAAFIRVADVEDKVSRSYSPLVTQLFTILPQRLSSALTIKELAGLLNVSESTLAKRFKKEIGMTVGAYMEQLIIERARQLLAAKTLSVGEIAEQLGFCDQFYFSRYFKEKQGETPSSYKRHMS